MPTPIRSYKDLEVWQSALELTETIYRVSAAFPPEEMYGLAAQIRRAAVSVAANIAEGAERFGLREYLRFLGIASGSLAETETHLIVCLRMRFLDEARVQEAQTQIDTTSRMLTGLKRSLLRHQ